MYAKSAGRPMWNLLVLEDVNTTRTKRTNTNNITTKTILSATMELKRTHGLVQLAQKENNHVIKLLHV